MLTLIGVALGLVAGVASAARAQVPRTTANQAPAKASTTSQPGGVPGADGGTSADLAITGYGDASGYHLEVGRESSGFAWHEIAVLDPDGIDDSSWTGYQCVSGDGRFAAVSILPASAVNLESARDHGGFAYSVNLATGRVRPVATGVGLMYFSPGCGTGDDAVFSLYPGTGQTSTQLLTADLATGSVTSAVTVTGQLSSAVPTASGPVAALGPDLVSVAADGKTSLLAAVGGQPFDLRPATDGGVNLLDARPGSVTSAALHFRAGTVTRLGSGPLDRMQLFGGENGRAVLSGAASTTPSALTASGVRAVSDAGLAHGAESSSLDGDALVGAAAKAAVAAPVVLSTRTAKIVTDAQAPHTARPDTAFPGYHPSGAAGYSVPDAAGALRPGPAAAGTGKKPAASTITTTAKMTTTLASQSPTCAVPRLDPAKQVMQPSPTQVNWAAQMAEQGLLTTGNGYSRPAGFDNLGLVAYAPNSDFPLIALDHPSGDSWNTVPRSVFEAIIAQESNWSQASWHAPQGVSGDPLIADYYGAGGGIDSIDYADADCGYGLSQVTDGMHVGDTSLSAHGQIKVAVDYQENIAAGLQILESTWNQLYSDGIITNNGDPRYLENWFFAAWAYNSGIEPTGSYDPTGCTAGPSCTSADGTWGLGWANNPENPAYPPNRDPYLKDTYADAAHPGDWPYEERIMGWMASPIIRYNGTGYSDAYATPTYNGGETWLQIPPFASFCSLSGNDCNPSATNTANPGNGHCQLSDDECWWHQPVTWITSCATTCATSSYAYTTGSTEPTYPDPDPPTCNVDTSVVPSGSIIVDDETSPPLNLQGCANENWTSNGTFSYTYGTDAAGDPIGAIDTHQLGTGLGGHILFSHTEDGSIPAEINTGTWTPKLPSLQYYKVKVHFPGLGAEATDVVYTINPGGGAAPWKIRVNQAWNTETWATIGTFAMENGGSVVLTNQSSSVDTTGSGYADYDVAFDAIAFVPMGGTPGTPIGGPPGIQDEPKGSNPAWVQCGCVARTAGDPVDTSTGYFGQTWTDLTTPGRGAALNLTRTYDESIADPNGPNGSLATDGPFGWGWTFSYDLYATTDSATGDVTIHQEDGSEVTFDDSGGTYTPSAPRYDATLTASGGDYVFTRRGQEIFTFGQTTGQLLSEQDPAGAAASPPYATTLAYNAAGQLSTITDPGGHTYTLTWTGGQITELADSAGRVITYAYDSGGDLTDVYGVGTVRSGGTAQDNDLTQYTYNGSHLMTSIRTPDNYGGAASAVTSMTYDSSERVISQTNADGDTTTFAYGPSDGLSAGQTLTTDPAGHETLDTYSAGLLTSETKGYGTPDAGTWTYTYDPVTLGISSETDPDGNLTTYSYDDHGNLISESNGLGVTTNYLYDGHDNLIETIDGNGVATVNQYNQAGHIPAGATGLDDLTSTTITQVNNVVESSTGIFGSAPTRTTNYYYGDAAHPGDLTKVVDPLGNATTTTYDAYGDKASVTDALGNKTLYGYDTGTGRLTSEVSPSGAAAGVTTSCTPPATGCTTFGYDAYGDLVKTTDALSHLTSSTYDPDGNKLSDTNGDGKTTTYAYDAAGQLVKTTAPDGTVSVTDYNPDGTIADTIDGLGDKTKYGYDGQARRDARTDPDGRTTGSAYDPAGLLTHLTNPSGQVTTMTYNAADELVTVSYSDGSTPGVSYGYDPDGNRVSMTDGTGTTTWAFDIFGDVTGKTTGAGATVSYGYDNAGNQTSILYPGQTTAVSQTFDADERLVTVTDPSGNTSTFGYTPDGQIGTVRYPNGDTVTDSYDDTDTLTSTGVTGAGGTVASASYGYDAAGQLTSEAGGSAPQSYTYSDRGQLASSAGGATGSYTVDAADNPTTVGGVTQTFDAASQLTSTGATTYTFNAEGNRTGATPATGTASSYGYNQAGQLISYTGQNGSASYTYDGTGLRATKTAGGATTSYVWSDQQTPNLLSDGTDDYLYGPDAMPIEQFGSGGTDWFVHDQIGSTALLLNASGAVAGSYAYTPYGGATHSGAASTPLQFTGQYTDPESGLVYLRARYYDPATGQFLTVDPMVDETGTPYAYVGDDPLDNTDLTGLCGFWCWVGVGAAVVGTAACIIAEPCGLAEGGIALSVGGAAVVTGGIVFAGAESIAGGAIVGGAVAGGIYAASSAGGSSGGGSSGNSSSSASSSSGGNDEEGCEDDDFENTGYSLDEIAEFARGHAGDDNPAMGRPGLSEIEDALKSGAKSPGGGNSIRFDYNGVRVIVNLDNPLRSTTYYPGR
ncbi:MAG: RHS repeat-associated core domain-containing protein [Trebonia sp.]